MAIYKNRIFYQKKLGNCNSIFFDRLFLNLNYKPCGGPSWLKTNKTSEKTNGMLIFANIFTRNKKLLFFNIVYNPKTLSAF